MYNINKLYDELINSGLKIEGVNSNGVISWEKEHPTVSEENTAKIVLENHNPSEYILIPNRETIVRGTGVDIEAVVRYADNPPDSDEVRINDVPVAVSFDGGRAIIHVVGTNPGDAMIIQWHDAVSIIMVV